ncbi:hypothetical protein MPAR168_00985 [Methylorubrum populi]|uniref:Uncharacterized protein n=1 Tax=Methylobacterium radiotolerans TaxID=31998 RepID=A0ABU7T8A1_9HYPH
MKSFAIAAAILFAVPVAAAAETTPAPQAAQPAPESAEKAPATPQERQQASAAKLAGLVRFVGESCKEAQPDYERFKAVVSAMGVDLDAISKGELLMRSMSYTEAYRKNVEESCRKAVELFGEKGSVIPGLVLRKAS